MKAYITFTKKRIFVLLALIFCVGFICCELSTVNNSVKNAKTNSDRLIFIKRLGYDIIDKNPTSKNITIPNSFSKLYNSYNALQKKADFDLSAYKGCEVMLYTYKIKAPKGYDGECLINIIVYNDRVIGGDVSSAMLDGFMLSIKN